MVFCLQTRTIESSLSTNHQANSFGVRFGHLGVRADGLRVTFPEDEGKTITVLAIGLLACHELRMHTLYININSFLK